MAILKEKYVSFFDESFIHCLLISSLKIPSPVLFHWPVILGVLFLYLQLQHKVTATSITTEQFNVMEKLHDALIMFFFFNII